MDVRSSVPTIVLVGGRLTLDDGSVVDSRQGTKDAATARAIRKALVSSPSWWSTVASVVIPTLDDAEGGFALTDQRTIARTTPDGRVGHARFPRYPRPAGDDDYIYNPRSRAELAKRLEKQRRASANTPRALVTEVAPPRIRIVTSGEAVSAESHTYRSAGMLVFPDTPAIRDGVQDLIRGLGKAEARVAEERPWQDPLRYLRLAVQQAECRVSGLVLNGQWEDPSGVEAARRLLLERFDLRLGLWDLALNPVLRASVLDPTPLAPIGEDLLEAPTLQRRRAEQEAGGAARALGPALVSVGWEISGVILQHRIVANATHQPSHPYLRILVGHHRVDVFAWHWGYTTFDINAFVDGRRAEFDAVSALPARKPISAATVRVLAKTGKPGYVRYEAGRLLNDTRSVLLWSAAKGWADLDADWSRIANEIAERTGPWVALLVDAVAECLHVDRRGLKPRG